MSLFDDSPEPLVKRKTARLKPLPSIPDTGWKAPEFPNLRGNVFMLGVDTETKDPELKEAGPGWGRHRGNIVGVSLAAVDYAGNRGKWYFPMRHEVEPEDNLDPDNVLTYLRYTLGSAYEPKVFAHATYDLGWLEEEGVKVEGDLHDVQYAEALIDNNARVALEVLATKYLREHKNDDLVMHWVQEAYGKAGNGPSEWRKNIFRTPPRLTGPYAEDDADLALRLLPMMGPLLDYNEMNAVYRLECDLIPMEMAMRRAGVSVDVDGAMRLKQELQVELARMYEQVWSDYNYDLRNADGDLASDSKVIGGLMDHVGIEYPRTAPSRTYPNGNASIKKEWLEELALTNPVGKLVNDIREHEKMIGTFLQSYIIDKNIDGFLYPQFHPLRGDENGTMLGRFSSSDPNLQNIPSRTKLGKRVRKLFRPDPGHALWRKNDYSQIHYRLLAHFAVDKGDGSAERLRQAYRDDPDMDYHMKVYQTTAPLMGWNTDYNKVPNKDGDLDWNEEISDKRRIIKNVNFSGLYGVGEATLIKRYLIGMSQAQGKAFLSNYHEGAPYVEATAAAIAAEATRDGYVQTLMGRRIRFELWEPIGRKRDDQWPLPYEEAIAQYGTFIQLAYLYRAVNYKFQGSEPDIMKMGMLKLWKSGVLDFVGVPRITCHDELGFSQHDKSPATIEAFSYIKHTMETAIPLRVPVKVDSTTGNSWGEAK